MHNRPTTLERAFELARSGEHPNLQAIRRQLQAERYSTAQLVGPALFRQLQALCAASHKPS